MGQAQRHWPSAACLFHGWILPPWDDGALHRPGASHSEARAYRSAALLSAEIDAPERMEALDRLHRLFHSRWARLLARTPALLYGLGIPPQQRALLGGDAPLNEVLYQRLLRLLNGHPSGTNYFAWQALRRCYPGPGDRCLPPYLQRNQFTRMRNDAGLIIPVHASLRQFLESLPAREVDAVVLLDSQDWMTVDEIRTLWDTIDRAGSDQARVIFRTAGVESPLEREELAPVREVWRRDEERSAIGYELDRSGIYRRLSLLCAPLIEKVLSKNRAMRTTCCIAIC